MPFASSLSIDSYSPSCDVSVFPVVDAFIAKNVEQMQRIHLARTSTLGWDEKYVDLAVKARQANS